MIVINVLDTVQHIEAQSYKFVSCSIKVHIEWIQDFEEKLKTICPHDSLLCKLQLFNCANMHLIHLDAQDRTHINLIYEGTVQDLLTFIHMCAHNDQVRWLGYAVTNLNITPIENIKSSNINHVPDFMNRFYCDVLNMPVTCLPCEKSFSKQIRIILTHIFKCLASYEKDDALIDYLYEKHYHITNPIYQYYSSYQGSQTFLYGLEILFSNQSDVDDLNKISKEQNCEYIRAVLVSDSDEVFLCDI